MRQSLPTGQNGSTINAIDAVYKIAFNWITNRKHRFIYSINKIYTVLEKNLIPRCIESPRQDFLLLFEITKAYLPILEVLIF